MVAEKSLPLPGPLAAPCGGNTCPMVGPCTSDRVSVTAAGDLLSCVCVCVSGQNFVPCLPDIEQGLFAVKPS